MDDRDEKLLTALRVHKRMVGADWGEDDVNELKILYEGTVLKQPISWEIRRERSIRHQIKSVLLQSSLKEQVSGVHGIVDVVVISIIQAALNMKDKYQIGLDRKGSNRMVRAGRRADLIVGGVAVHVATTPNDDLLSRCEAHFDAGLRAIVVTRSQYQLVIEEMAKQHSNLDSIDVFEVEQYIAQTIYELGYLGQGGWRAAIYELIWRYNDIISGESDISFLAMEIR